jgi:hypothetical protein
MTMARTCFERETAMLVLGISLFVAAPSAQSTKEGQQVLTVTLAADRARYSLRDHINLDVRLTNVSNMPVTVFGELLWGYAGGLVLHVTDSSGREIPSRTLDDDMVVPSALVDRISFAVLNRNHYLGTTRVEPLEEFIREPGTYFIEVQYLSPVSRELGQGPGFWSREKGPVRSNKIGVHVGGE